MPLLSHCLFLCFVFRAADKRAAVESQSASRISTSQGSDLSARSAASIAVTWPSIGGIDGGGGSGIKRGAGCSFDAIYEEQRKKAQRGNR